MGFKRIVFTWLGVFAAVCAAPLAAQDEPVAEVIFTDVRIFDGTSDRLSPATNVLVRGNIIAAIGAEIRAESDNAAVIEGRGGTLIPGLIDNHVHMMFNSLSPAQMSDPDMGLEKVMQLSAGQARAMLLRGFTSVRDVGGPSFELKRLIDSGRIMGPRIWPSGPMISQTSGHADLRGPNEPSRRFSGKVPLAEQVWASVIADGRAEVLTAVRENLRLGASQIKIAAGGGTSSEYDPLDVTQYTLDEMQAAVDAASDWNTYVTVHAYHPKSVRRAIEAGVKVIEHGNLLDEDTLKLMADKGIWLSGQMLVDSTEAMDPKRREKRKPVIEGQRIVWPMAKRLGVKLAWGTDFLFEPELNAQQNTYLLRLKPYFTPAELLRLATNDNAALLAMSGPRSPYEGRLGVVEVGALADLILVDGDPLANIDLIGDPEGKFVVIMKNGELVKGGR
ncbi:metal-dependent hydrolase family protein [Porphyrobacter sp. AAP60]|uniref:metal-dependent hydrolase family protein n=1 Tax=Porphyrobacter sp. AAP60 TaxID=1523423 RepID=UPI000AE30113|nr:amidohydrolase family protein [Porphyrobacter sp. AAP60]